MRSYWWRKHDKRWHKVPYGDGVPGFFWDMNCGFFYVTVARKGRGLYEVSLVANSGSIDEAHDQMFEGTEAEAKRLALGLAKTALFDGLEQLP